MRSDAVKGEGERSRVRADAVKGEVGRGRDQGCAAWRRLARRRLAHGAWACQRTERLPLTASTARQVNPAVRSSSSEKPSSLSSLAKVSR